MKYNLSNRKTEDQKFNDAILFIGYSLITVIALLGLAQVI